MRYFITRGESDRMPHIYEMKSPVGYYFRHDTEYDSTWDGLVIEVDGMVIPNKPLEIGGEFNLLARRWVILSIDHMTYSVTCAIANTEGYRLLLHQIIFKSELRLMMTLMWRSMPKYMAQECYNELMLLHGGV